MSEYFAINPDGGPGVKFVVLDDFRKMTALPMHNQIPGRVPVAYACYLSLEHQWVVVSAADIRFDSAVWCNGKDDALRELKRVVGRRFPRIRRAG